MLYEEGMIGSELYFIINGEVEVRLRAAAMRPCVHPRVQTHLVATPLQE